MPILLIVHDAVACQCGPATRAEAVYFDELPRITRAHREFAAALLDRSA